MGRSWTASQTDAMTLRGKTLLVSAAAGSGKTSVLTERIIRALTDPEHPADLSRMLVVTFTRAAAAELKARIAAALSDAMAAHPENKALAHQLFLLGSAQISTIDSFFQKAVRANFDQFGLQVSFRPADENEVLPLAMEILDDLIEEFYQKYDTDTAEDSLFGRITGNRFAAALDHLMSDRSDGNLTPLLLRFAKSYANDPQGVKVLQQCASHLRDACDREYLTTAYGLSLLDHIQSLFEGFLEELLQVQAHVDASPDLAAKCGNFLHSDLQFCRAMLDAPAGGGYARLREVAYTFIAGRFPNLKGINTSVTDHYQEWRQKFKEEVKDVQGMLSPTVERIRLELSATAELCEILYDFYSEYEKRLLAAKTERGILEYNDVRALLYSHLVNEDGTPTPFADALAAQYDEVYIDEYQDVDFLQDRIFALIGRGHRFMVGDIKQSIYGFRGSEPSIFAAYRRSMPLHTSPEAAAADGNCIFMSENFRCDRPVINFANRVCAFLFSACEESIGYRPQDDLVCSKNAPDKEQDGHPAPVRVAIFEAAPRKSKKDAEETEERVHEEAVWVAAEISRLLREEKKDDGTPIRPSDIAILLRKHDHGAAYAAELRRLQIPVAASTSADLLKDPLLSDLLNLLRAIDNPYRDLPLSEFLLSPLGGFDLEELSCVRQAAEASVPLYDAIETYISAPDALGEKCRYLVAFLQTQRERAAVEPADRFLRLLYLEESVHPYADQPASLFLYEQARIYQRSSFCGLYGFLSHFSKLLESEKLSADGFSKAEEAVTIMTIHHSKGLEFPVVFLSSTGARFNRESAKSPILYHRSVGLASKLYNRETGAIENTALHDAVQLTIDREDTEESIRTLYVALTRARERLYVTGTLSGGFASAHTAASLIRRGMRAAILGASNMLAWIMAAMAESPIESADWQVACIPYGTVATGAEWQPSAAPTNTSTPTLSQASARYAALAARKASFVYPLAHLRELPTKIAASKIAPDLIERLDGDEHDTAALDAQIELMRAATPSFEAIISNHKKPSAADIGTATHAFLQFCDFSALQNRTIEEECARLVSDGFLAPESAAILNKPQLNAFCKSDLFTLISSARRVRREQKFSLFLPAENLTQDEARRQTFSQETVFVQGSIDLLLEMPDGEILLIDYKTDRISPALAADEEALCRHMTASHGMQLAVYARAVEELFGVPPREVRIYSLPLGRTIPLSLPSSLDKT